MSTAYARQFFCADLEDVDPFVGTLIQLEQERQKRRLILIPSESYAPAPVRQALGSVFNNVYAEGYPPSSMVANDEALLGDLSHQLAHYRRYADRRFYKGADYVHFVEALAQRRAASCFANERANEDQIYVNVQPLSGAVANLAVYDALMEPGETLMGMDLFQGGHLTHGSQFNVSGKRFKVVSYGVSKRDERRYERLDYAEILDLAREARPKVIVAGYTSYPWAPDFERFRQIADEVGAYLLADVAHPAGMVIAGQYPNPVGLADVVTFTTHKTLCGPRGACILSTDRELAARIDAAVFPGIQGGPHPNKFAAMAVAFEIARSEAFRALQQQIVENAQALAEALTRRGLRLAYGGTDTHLLLLDLKSAARSGNGALLYGEPTARILELAGLVVNKQTIPGDMVTALATGIRLGTPWVTQRGMGADEMDQLAGCIARIVHGIEPFTYQGINRAQPRGRIDLDLLNEVKRDVDAMSCAAPAEIECGGSGYPHYDFCSLESEQLEPLFAPLDTEAKPGRSEALSLIDLSQWGIVCVCGRRAQPMLQDVCTVDVSALRPGQGTQSLLLDKDGRVLDRVAVWRIDRDRYERDSYLVLTHPENTSVVVAWLRGLSDGYALFDDGDVWRKVRGPAKVELWSEPGQTRMGAVGVVGSQAGKALAALLSDGTAALASSGSIAQVRYQDRSLWFAAGAPLFHGDGFGLLGAEQDVKAVWGALTERGAQPAAKTREQADAEGACALLLEWQKTLDVEEWRELCPQLFDVHKSYFVGQQKLSLTEAAPEKPAFVWEEPSDVPPKRTPLYAEHEALGAKLIEFAGWEMPVWYSGVGTEHQAVRERAGLFDVGHMGTIEVCGPYAVDFLDLVTVNYVWRLMDGRSHYSGLLDAEGRLLDDVIVYRRAWDRFLVVVNAVNSDKDWAWLNAVNEGQVILDSERPWVSALHRVTLRNLHDEASGEDRRMDIALQGPASLDILLACIENARFRGQVARLSRTFFVEGEVGGIPALVSRTGYTGEEVGYELYVHPGHAVDLWRLLLERGETYGVQPCGLAARDSTRIEAGLPLYGHELAGPLAISQNEAGFGYYVKYHKPFFVGRDAYKARNDVSTRSIARFQVTERGARALRGGEPVVNRRGRVVGQVTSCALVGERQVGMALVEERYATPETALYLYPETRRAVSKTPADFETGDTVALPVEAEVLTRFPVKE